MEEKYMVKDILNDSKNNIKIYTDSLLETENVELRNTIQNLRNFFENFQYNLFKISESKGYNSVAQSAKQDEIQKVKNELNI